jgi:hypothetical protein
MQDLMVHLNPAQSEQLQQDFLSDVYKMTNISFDRVFDGPAEIFLKATTGLQRGLSMQAAFGDRFPHVPRSMTSKLAWIMLNMRMIGLTIVFSFQNTGTDSETPNDLNKPGND